MEKVTIYTDGACSGNPGPGGWAAVLIYKDARKEISGGKKETTNNEMEITAVLEALKILKRPCEIMIYSDSAYVVNTFNKGWIYTWVRNNWVRKDVKTKKEEQVKNKELWEELYLLCQKHKVTFNKVKGHSDVELNNRCDELARAEIKKLR